LFKSEERPPKDGKKEDVGALVDDTSALPEDRFGLFSGLLKLNGELLPAPVLAPGGGPAGVVEFPKIEVLGLLVGVVVFTSPKVLLPNSPPPPEAAPNTLWEAAPASAGLLGVEKIDPEGALLACCPTWAPENAFPIENCPNVGPPPAAG
jgi:hypothetical protein